MIDIYAARSGRAAAGHASAMYVALLLLCCSATGIALAKEKWQPVAAAELAEDKPKLDPNAPAEALAWKLEIDDSDFPQSRDSDEYVRYKIYDPSRADAITRISTFESNLGFERVDVHARLTLPNGEVHEFGPDAMKERTLAKEGNTGGFLGWLNGSGTGAITEKFLAIPGIERGSVLEYHVVRRQQYPASGMTAYPLQREAVPARSVEFLCHVCRETSDWAVSAFVLNKLNGEMKSDRKAMTVRFHASNVPAIVREPFVGPRSDYAMTVLYGYEALHQYVLPRSGHVPTPGTIDSKPGPWTGFATMANWFDRDRGYPTARVKKLAAEITAGAATDEAKAIAIHNFVQELNQKDRHHAHPKRSEMQVPRSLDDVLDVDKAPEFNRTSVEFLWLAVGLYNSAGLEAHTILLPDRQLARFNPKFVSPAFLSHEAIAVRVNGEWRFSSPNNITPLPFGMLPWPQEGQLGLLALDRKQEFVEVPLTSAEQSLINTTGKFTLDLAGTLTGDVRREYTGQTANTIRVRLRGRTSSAARLAVVRAQLGVDTTEAEVTDLKITGVTDATRPVVITAHVRWPGYAARTKERLIVKAAIFESASKSPFSATERHYAISFPYHWQEREALTIQVPEGFAPEAPSAPPPLSWEILRYRLGLAYDQAHRTLHVTRTFVSNAIEVPVEAYPAIKNWYDNVARADAHEVIFAGHNVPMPDAAATPAAAPAKTGSAEATDLGEGATDGASETDAKTN